ncbi:hypothetical protein VB796_06495 [Arcicella sp. LKC2W]|uniref:hypothetical protein n=1 Tax=Arcicella sp. LKC2W TaxID=2984198 RepID=UPI002B1FA3B3|nr:hypothetical protein [Arcicella sp. LKC2W]MEA5458676.1 hypothetical protein [Arcicella sp. LKC2W]
MKKLFKILLYLFAFITANQIHSQSPVSVSNGVITLKGSGNLGGLKDGSQLRRYKNQLTGSFYLQGYVRSLTNSSKSFTGLAIRNESSAKTDGGLPSVMLVFQNDTLRCLTKLTANQPLMTVVKMAIKFPGYLKVVKDNNDFVCYYSKDAEGLANPSFTKWVTIPNAFTGWTNISQNFITGSSLSTAQTAVVSNVKYGSITPTPVIEDVPVIVLVGESNAGSKNLASTALTAELGLRSKVKIWNNKTRVFETLNIPNNNNFGEHDQAPGSTWGWELPIANAIDAGTIPFSTIYIIKTAQGGAKIGEYNDDIVGGYFSTLKNRIDSAKVALTAMNKNPIFTVMYSLGINNANAPTLTDPGHFPNLSGTPYYKAATKTFIGKIRNIVGANTKICFTKFQSPFDAFCNGAIDEIVAENTALNFAVTGYDLPLQADGLHWNASGTKQLADRQIATLNYFKFTGSNTVPAPTLTANPSSVVANSTVTLTVTGCSGTVTIYTGSSVSSASSPYTISYPTQGSVYTAKCTVGGVTSGASNAITVGASPVNEGGGSSTTPNTPFFAFTNTLKTVPVETQTDKFSPHLFGNIPVKLKDYDATRKMPKYPIVWHHKLDNFANNGKRWYDVGIAFAIDHIPVFGGAGQVKCVDWIYYNDPSTGQAWTTGKDPECAKGVNDFVSAIPFHYKAFGDGGTVNDFGNITNDQLYDLGHGYTRSATLGYGDNEGNKTNLGLVITDVENGEHGRDQEIPLVIGMAENVVGLAVDMYGQSITIAYPTLSHYPIDYITGGYSATRINIDGSSTTDANNVINALWNQTIKVDIPSKGISQKNLTNYPNAAESSEISSSASAVFRQGETIHYDNDNPNLTRQTNKFGVNRNAEHPIAHTMYGVEVRKWHLRKNYPQNAMFTLTKALADRNNIGLTTWGKHGDYIDNLALKSLHHNRRTVLGQFMMTAMGGSYYYHWDRNSENKDLDGINAIFQGAKMINQDIVTSVGTVSFVDLFDQMDFKLWTSEISYDNGVTWESKKGTDYIMSQTSITQFQALSSNGIWFFYLHRNENTEKTACKLRIKRNGLYHYVNITNEMWETTNPAYKDTAKSQIPNSDKDYIFGLLDLNASTGTAN